MYVMVKRHIFFFQLFCVFVLITEALYVFSHHIYILFKISTYKLGFLDFKNHIFCECLEAFLPLTW